MAGKDGFPPASVSFNEIEKIKVVSEDEIEIKLKKADSALYML